MTGNNTAGQPEYNDEKPPVFSSWNKFYTLVLLNLAALIVLFYIFTKTFD